MAWATPDEIPDVDRKNDIAKTDIILKRVTASLFNWVLIILVTVVVPLFKCIRTIRYDIILKSAICMPLEEMRHSQPYLPPPYIRIIIVVNILCKDIFQLQGKPFKDD